MIRIFSILIGAFFSLALLLAFGTGAYSYITEPPAKTAEARFHLKPEHLALSSNGWCRPCAKAACSACPNKGAIFIALMRSANADFTMPPSR